MSPLTFFELLFYIFWFLLLFFFLFLLFIIIVSAFVFTALLFASLAFSAFTPVVSATWPLAQAEHAVAAVETGHAAGNVVVVADGGPPSGSSDPGPVASVQ